MGASSRQRACPFVATFLTIFAETLHYSVMSAPRMVSELLLLAVPQIKKKPLKEKN